MQTPAVIKPIRLGVWASLRLQLCWAYDTALDAIYKKHAYVPIGQAAWLIRRGQVKLTFRSEQETFGAGYWVFPREEDGWQEFSDDIQLLSIRFHAEWPTGEPLFDRSKTLAIRASELAEFTRISERLARNAAVYFPGVTSELGNRLGSLRQHLAFHRTFSGWLSAYVSAMERLGLIPNELSHMDERVRNAIHELDIQPLNQPFSEHILAKQYGLSLSQFNKLFVRDTKQTPKEYWDQKRIRAARLALMDSSRSIKAIALDMGFHSQSHFSSWSKKVFGKAPRYLRTQEP